MKYNLTKTQKLALNGFVSGANMFITGKGGTGKSFLTRYIIDRCKANNKQVIVCAPTGVAAQNIGGSTIHRQFKASLGIKEPTDRCTDKKKIEMLSATDVLIIDEISMCRVDLFQYICNTLKALHKAPQLILVGDFYQLPPVVTDDDTKALDQFPEYYEKRYAFEATGWTDLKIRKIELSESMRQTDKDFITALDSIRIGEPHFEIFGKNQEPDNTAITLCPFLKQADEINRTELSKLLQANAESCVYTSVTKGKVTDKDHHTDKELTLCIGAKVMLLVNDKDGMYVNGDTGIIDHIGKGEVGITLDKGEQHIEVKPYKWSITEYQIRTKESDDDDWNKKKIAQVEIGSIEQLPVRLAWAISIHKSQGQTYDKCNVNAAKFFAEGQMYVALSRCRTLAGLRIQGELKEENLLCSQRVINWNKAESEKIQTELNNSTDSLVINPEDADRYKEGYDDGYEEGWTDGTEDARTKAYQEFKQQQAEDKSIKHLSAYTTREKEKEGLPPEERNPKNAGRKKLPINELNPSKAIRVPGIVADVLKELGDIAKERPDEVLSLCQDLISKLN